MRCIHYIRHEYDMSEELAQMWLEVEDEQARFLLALSESSWEQRLNQPGVQQWT